MLFLLAAVGIGLLLSAVAATMQQAMLYSMLLIMPFSLLSGLTTPISSMPSAVQYLTAINPLRYAIDITRRVYLEGAGLDLLMSDLWPLGADRGADPDGGLLDVQPPHAMTAMSSAAPPCPKRAAERRLDGGAASPPAPSGRTSCRPTPQTPAHWSAARPRRRRGRRRHPAAHRRSRARSPSSPRSCAPGGRAFDDPELSSLIERALDANLDLRAAVLRIEEARAQRAIAAAAYWPTLSADASYSRQRFSETTPTGSLFNSVGNIRLPGGAGISIPNPYNQFQLSADASWEIDLFGRVRRSVEAADASVQVSVEDQRSVWCPVLADVAQSYTRASRRAGAACASPGRISPPSRNCWI